MIPLSNCKRGTVYLVLSRNLEVGVFDGDTGFIGIRTKLGSDFLFTEYHWDTGDPYGTVKPLQEIGNAPEDIVLSVDSRELFRFLLGIERTRALHELIYTAEEARGFLPPHIASTLRRAAAKAEWAWMKVKEP